jgi:chemotaxis protein methyltransferase CheR
MNVNADNSSTINTENKMEEKQFVPGILKITDEEFNKIRDLVYSKFGINLTEKKKSLVIGRLNKLIKSLGLKSFNEYYETVINDSTNASLLSLVDKISTNHTFFYREKDHFELLVKRVLPEITEIIKRQGKNDLRIWCAGCSTGEEPYTIAMLINEFFGFEINNWDIGILATDISVSVLEIAEKGIYPKERTSELPANLKNKYIKKIDNDIYEVDKKLKELILFKRLNLMNETFPFKGKFHLVFCRNVMIYFDKETREKLVNKFYNYIHQGGYFFVGHSESLDRRVTPFIYLQPAVYWKNN